MDQRFDRSKWDRRAIYVSVLALFVSMSAATFAFFQWRTAENALQDSRNSQFANFAVVASVFRLDANNVKNYFETDRPISIGDIDRGTIWMGLTIINNGPGRGAIQDLALVRKLGETEFWNGFLPDQKFDCDSTKRVNDIRCSGIWPISFDKTESYLFYIPLGSIFDALRGGGDGGLVVKLNARGARTQFCSILSGIRFT